VALIERLVDPATVHDANTQLAQLRAKPGDPEVLAARRDPAPLLAAIDRSRRTLVATNPGAATWYEHTVCSALVDFGLRRDATRLLREFLGDADDARLSDAEVVARAQCLTLLSDLASLGSDYATAEAAGARAVALVERARGPAEADAGITAALADALGARARALVQMGVLREADRWLRRQETAAAQSGDLTALDRACQVRAQYHLVREDAGRAAELIAQRRAVLGERPLNPVLAALGTIAELAAASAGEQDADADRLTDELRTQLGDGRMPADLRVQGELACARHDLRGGRLVQARAHVDASRAAAASGADAGALGDPVLLGEIEAVSSMILRDGPTAADGAAVQQQAQQLRQRFDEMVDSWRRAPLREDGIAFLASRARRMLVSELIALTMLQHGEQAGAERAIADLLTLQELGSSAREQAVPATTLAEVRTTLLGDGDGVLLWQVAQQQSHVFAFDRAGITYAALPGWGQLMPDLKALWQALSRLAFATSAATQRDLGAEILAQSRAVAAQFLPPPITARMASWRQVLQVDHGLPSGMPLECLSLDGKALLGERLAITTLASLPTGVHWQRTRHQLTPRARARFDLIATLRGDPTLAPAAAAAPKFPPEMAARLRAPYAAFGGLTDVDATVARVRALANDAPVTHLLAHGAQDRTRTRACGLALTPGPDDPTRGFFGCDDVERARYGGVIVLSACGVGRPLERVGDESYLGTLGGAFLRAGAHTVIQSAAELPFEPHVELCMHLHAGMAHGWSPARALRHARAALRGGDLANRFIHAQVTAHGLGHRAVLE
jgi:hypothetical protein